MHPTRPHRAGKAWPKPTGGRQAQRGGGWCNRPPGGGKRSAQRRQARRRQGSKPEGSRHAQRGSIHESPVPGCKPGSRPLRKMEITLEAMPQLVPENGIRNLRARGDRAKISPNVPRRASQMTIRPSAAKADPQNPSAILSNILAHLPRNYRGAHDPPIRSRGLKAGKLIGRQI